MTSQKIFIRRSDYSLILTIQGMITKYCPLSYIFFVVSAFWKRFIYQMKAGSFPDRLLPNTYKSYCCSLVLYSTLISLTVFLAVKKCAFVPMHGGSAVTFLMNWNCLFVESMYDSFVKQKMTSMQVCTFVEYGIWGFFMMS